MAKVSQSWKRYEEKVRARCTGYHRVGIGVKRVRKQKET